MNQYRQMFRALLPDSWLVWLGIIMVAVVSIVNFAFGIATAPIMAITFGAAAFGFAVWNYQNWENSHLVPRMTQTCVVTAIAMTLGL